MMYFKIFQRNHIWHSDYKEQLLYLNKLSYNFIFFLLFAGCKATNMPHGSYCLTKKQGPDHATLHFNSNKTFTGTNWSDIAGEFTINGFWEIHKGTVLLRVIPKRIIDSIVIQGVKQPSGNLSISVFDRELNKPLFGALLSDKQNMQTTDIHGQAVLPFPKGEHLQISFFSITDSIAVSEIKGDSIILFLNFSNARSYKLAEKWKLKRNLLVPHDNGAVYRKCTGS